MSSEQIPKGRTTVWPHEDLIIQYQAKYEKDIECGGGYVKAGEMVIFEGLKLLRIV